MCEKCVVCVLKNGITTVKKILCHKTRNLHLVILIALNPAIFVRGRIKYFDMQQLWAESH